MTDERYTTRIAPSPTGDMHLGTARTAYFNWLASKSTNGRFILRIDDTDKKRSKQEYTDVILETMDWLGLRWDNLVYQSDKTDSYMSRAEMLIDHGVARREANGAIALELNEYAFPSYWSDEISNDIPITENDHKVIRNMIIMKGDGSPAYNFATVVDDIDLDINYIIRGVDHMTNTSKQVILYKLLGATLPKFAHVGLITKDKKKLSKRDGAASMLKYKDGGYDPDGLLNFMLRLGWSESSGKTTKIIDKELAKELFWKAGKMRSQPSGIDLNMLNLYNKRHISAKQTRMLKS